MTRVFLFLSLASLGAISFGTWADTSHAASAEAILRGRYSFKATRVCAQNKNGVDALGRLQSTAATSTSFDTGTATYNGDGTGTLTGRSLTILHAAVSAGQVAALEGEFACNFTYTVTADRRSFSSEMSCATKVLSGPTAGSITNVTGIKGRGEILDSARQLVLDETSINIETVTLPDNETNARICHRNATSYKIR